MFLCFVPQSGSHASSRLSFSHFFHHSLRCTSAFSFFHSVYFLLFYSVRASELSAITRKDSVDVCRGENWRESEIDLCHRLRRAIAVTRDRLKQRSVLRAVCVCVCVRASLICGAEHLQCFHSCLDPTRWFNSPLQSDLMSQQRTLRNRFLHSKTTLPFSFPLVSSH